MASASMVMPMEMPHAVLIPYPTSGHLNPMLELAKLLQLKGFFITFVNTHFSHHQLLQSSGLDALSGTDTLRFETVADGVSQSDTEGPGHVFKVWALVMANCGAPLRELILKLKNSASTPPVTCIITNFLLNFTQGVAEEIGVPELVFWTTSACGLMAALQTEELVRRGYVPLKEESCLTNGFLDTALDWIPGMKDMRLRDMSSFVRTTNLDDFLIKAEIKQVGYAQKSWGLILNTFDIESEVLDALRSFFPRIYSLGAMGDLVEQVAGTNPVTISMRLSFWREDLSCLRWLDAQEEASVIYVSFGSLRVLTPEQLVEFAWGLARSKKPFLWIIRPDMLDGGGAAFPEEFVTETKERGFFASWCDQRRVLAHRSVGGFLTHGGWNSMLESVSCGVPMICWPDFADQYANCRYACKHWKFSLEIEEEDRREQVKELIVDLLEGERGVEMRKNAKRWREVAKQAARGGGSSYLNLERLVKDLNDRDMN